MSLLKAIDIKNHYSLVMENKITNQSQADMVNFICSKAFLETPSWGEFFYYAKDRETLMDLFDYLLDEGFTCIEQPHEYGCDIFVAKLVDTSGRHILLRSK